MPIVLEEYKAKMLGIFLRPSDEMVFGWPILQRSHIPKHLIFISSTPEDLVALSSASKVLNFTWESLELDGVENNEKEITQKIESCLDKNRIVFTHPYSEYKSLFDIIQKNFYIQNMDE